MDQYMTYLHTLEDQKVSMETLLTAWSSINSGTYNIDGLNQLFLKIKDSFASLNGKTEEINLSPKRELSAKGEFFELPLGKALKVTKRPEAPIQVLLGGHMDIAFGKDMKLPAVQKTNDDRMIGRGTADMKSGLIIMLSALQAFEKSPFAQRIGWTVFINPDEEVGSPGSAHLWKTLAKDKKIVLIFEPSLSDGSLVSGRKASANYSLHVRGRAAHAGREFHRGQNAIASCARFALAAERLTDLGKELTINIGYMHGGASPNIVPDNSFLKFNVRSGTQDEMNKVRGQLHKIADIENHREGLKATLFQESERPPKIFDKNTRYLFEALKTSANTLGFDLQWKSSGGVCDGNLTASQGTPTIDTLGGVGGNLHTDEEYVILSSMVQRAKLTARFLMQIAAGEITIP